MITLEEVKSAAAAVPRAAGAGRDMLGRYAGTTVLAIGAHPDDVELGMGGTVAVLTRLGARVRSVICSVPGNGEARREESLKAARLLGADVEFLFPGSSRRLEDLKSYELTERLEALCRRSCPAAVFCHGPEDFHRDHIMVYQSCADALGPEGADLFCYAPTSTRPIAVRFRPQVYIDVGETIDRKLEAVHTHTSQFGGRGLSADFLRDAAGALGQGVGLRYAEGFQVVRLRMH